MTSANYCAIRDADTKGLYIGGDIDLDIPFTLPGTAIVGHQSVLSFMLKLKDPDDLKFKISIVNGKEVEHTVVSCTAQPNIWRAFQEVVDPNVLTP